MLGNLTPDQQQQAVRMYMAQQGGQANPVNMNRMVQQLAANPQMAQAAINLFMNNQASMTDRGGSGTVGSRIDDLATNMMAQDGTGAQPAAARGGGGGQRTTLPPRRPKEAKPTEEPYPERPRKFPKTPEEPPKKPAEDDPSSGPGWGWLGALLGTRALVKPKVLPPEAGGPVATRASTDPRVAGAAAAQEVVTRPGPMPVDEAVWRDVDPRKALSTDPFDKAFARDLPPAAYDLPPPRQQLPTPPEEPEARRATGEVIEGGKPRERRKAGSSNASGAGTDSDVEKTTTAKTKLTNIKMKPRR